MKCMKSLRSRLYLRVLPLFLSCIVFLSSTLGIRAEEITPTPTITPQDVFYIATEEFIDQIWDPLVSYVSLPFAIMNKSFATAEDYYEWLENLGEPAPWEQYPQVTVHSTHPPTGNIPLDVEQSTSVEVPLPVQNSILAFVQYQIAQNPQGFKECYISSYNYLNTSQFSNFQLYSSVKEVIKQHDLSFIMAPNGWDGYQGRYAYICCVDRSKFDINFYGSTLNGVFTSVYIEHNWSQYGFPYNTAVDGIEYYMFANNKTTLGHGNTIQSCWYDFMGYNGSTWTPPTNGTIKNTTGIGTSTSALNVFTGSSHDELVYVFDTINAYKNYNSGVPKDYYLTSEGISDPSWDASGNGIINTGQLDQSTYSYNNVISNVQSGWTAEEVLALVDRISSSSNTGGGESSGSNDNTGIWKGIGEAIGSLITGIATVVSEVASALSNAILSIINIFVGDDGLFSKLTNLVDTGFSNFLSAVFSWLPPEIVTLFSATLIFGIFFAIWKMLRG